MEGRSLFVESPKGKKLRHHRGLVHFGIGQKLVDALKANGLVRSTSPSENYARLVAKT